MLNGVNVRGVGCCEAKSSIKFDLSKIIICVFVVIAEKKHFGTSSTFVEHSPCPKWFIHTMKWLDSLCRFKMALDSPHGLPACVRAAAHIGKSHSLALGTGRSTLTCSVWGDSARSPPWEGEMTTILGVW